MRKLHAAVAVGAAVLAFAAPAHAATTWTVGSNKVCPDADFTKVQQAIDAASAGDTIEICAGTYLEGNGKAGTNALTIDKNLTLKGAGVDQTIIEPKDKGGLAEASPNLRDGKGDIIAAVGATDQADHGQALRPDGQRQRRRRDRGHRVRGRAGLDRRTRT